MPTVSCDGLSSSDLALTFKSLATKHTETSIRGATQNFQEFEYTAQTISATNLRR